MHKHAIIILSFLGLLVSGYLLSISANTGICSFGDKFNCQDVQNSKYSEIFGVKVALLGFLTYLFIGAYAIYAHTIPHHKTLFYIVLLSFLFQSYLTGIEAFVLQTYCVFCLASQALLLLLLALTWRTAWTSPTKN